MKGERRSKRKGQSVEFADFRAYVPGDDLRTIDWNLYARLDKLIVKLFLEEEDLHFYTLIDASRSMDFGEPSKLDYAKQLAAALGFVDVGPERPSPRARVPRPKKRVADARPHHGHRAWRDRVAGRRREKFLRAQRGPRHRG